MFSVFQINYNLRQILTRENLDKIQDYLSGIGRDFVLKKLSDTLNNSLELEPNECFRYYVYFHSDSPWDAEDNSLIPDIILEAISKDKSTH